MAPTPPRHPHPLMGMLKRTLTTHKSLSDINSSSAYTSSHNHLLTQFRSIPTLSSWIHESLLPQNHRHERIAMGVMSMGIAVMTREMMEMHIVQAPDVRGFLDCVPVADRSNMGFIGWRQKVGTWPLSKHEALTSRQFAA